MMKSIISLLLALALPLAAADANAYKEALERGKASLTQQKYADALKHLQEAATADPSQYEPYFNLAVVSYRTGDLKAAETFATTALKKAPETEKKTVREMIVFIQGKRDFTKFVAEADEAMESGLIAKAADAYRSAYLAFPEQGEVGLKAADLFNGRLNRLLDAAVLWQRIIRSGDRKSVAIAQEKLAERGNDLEKLYEAQIKQSERYRETGDINPLLILTQAFPQKPEPHLHLAALHARKTDVSKTIQNLVAANKAGVQSNALLEFPEFSELLGHSGGTEFKTFLIDAYGNELYATLQLLRQQRENKRVEARQMLEQKQAEQERKILRANQRKANDLEREKTVRSINQLLGKLNNAIVTTNVTKYTREDTIINTSRLDYDPATGNYLFHMQERQEFYHFEKRIARTNTLERASAGWAMSDLVEVSGNVPSEIWGERNDGRVGDLTLQFGSLAKIRRSFFWTKYSDGKPKISDDFSNKANLLYSGSPSDLAELKEAFFRLKRLDTENAAD